MLQHSLLFLVPANCKPFKVLSLIFVKYWAQPGKVSQGLHCHYGLSTHIGESLFGALTSACLLPDTGARNVDSLLNQQILPVLSQQLLTHMAAKQKTTSLTLGWSEDQGISMEFTCD